MRGRLRRFAGELQEARTREDLDRLVHGLRDQYGVDHLVYHSVSGTGKQFGILTYSPAWVSHYLAQGYARIDPVVQNCLRRGSPTDWKALEWSGRQARDFLGEAISAGVGNQGFSIPIHGPGGQFAMFTVSHRSRDADWQRFSSAAAPDLILIAHYLNQRVHEIDETGKEDNTGVLSGREVDVMTLLALGMNRAQAADALDISEHTFRAYVESARQKLGAANTVQAVARAVAGRHVNL